MTTLRACDIVLTHSDSLVGAAIRWFTRSKGEAATVANHVGIMVDSAHIVEALAYVLCRPINTVYAGKQLAIFRPLNLTAEDMHVVVLTAESFVGRKYGWRKIVEHGLERFVGSNFLTRLVGGGDDAPDCDWVVSKSYAAAGKDFGKPAGRADPDDIHDFVLANPDKYVRIWPPPESADATGKWM